MDLSGIVDLLSEHPDLQRFLDSAGVSEGAWRGAVLDPAKPAAIAALHRSLGRPVMVLTTRPETAKDLAEQLNEWSSDAENSVHLFPEPDALPYERRSWEQSVVLDRLRVLHLLSHRREPAPIIVASLLSVVIKTLDARYFSGIAQTLRTGMRIDPAELLEGWARLGYEADRAVEVPGTFSRRGGIIDVYSPVEERPIRLDLFGPEIESIRTFSPQDQQSTGSLDSATVVPTTEALVEDEEEARRTIDRLDLTGFTPDARARFEEVMRQYIQGAGFEGRESYAHLFQRGAFFDYLPKETVLVLDDPTALENGYAELCEEAEELRQQQIEKGELSPSFPQPHLEWKEVDKRISSFSTVVRMERWERSGSAPSELAGFKAIRNYGGHLRIFLRDLRTLLREDHRVAIVSHQAGRLSELLQEADIIAAVSKDVSKPPLPGSITLAQGVLSAGWSLQDGGPPLDLFTDKEIFGFTKQRRAVRRRPVRREAFASELAVGDHVVHVDHGIGRFSGMAKMNRTEGEREYLTLEYADGARLYVPNDQIDRVSPYIGSGDSAPALNRLGSQEWTRAKRRVKESTEAIARELLALYARREVQRGYAFGEDTPWQQELEASFPYVETLDQLETIRAVKADMEKARPMDRLVCGDVGYGKTEVAVRAGFKAVMSGKQVAVLVPTTVLAQQHLHTFRERLEAFPIEIDMLSRFRSHREQKQVIEALKTGSVDVCIGTHRLLQKDIEFKDLGLVVIDEEQRFGVAHKERLKRMREEIDVLTLSATPIPRTMHMSLVGVRDMSTMETPPEERLPIKTYVQEFDDELVREAILREMDRGGQVFFVHNRVQNINGMAERLRREVPRAEIAVAHGQMPEQQLESVMLDFFDGRYDVLVCSTIIESGLDMPNVNTIIINDADKMGLSQLYQLRGRVGRGTDRAYAYFLFGRYRALTEVAEKRLTSILAASELGAGFRIAMKDLEIRGAGNLLGVEQSGHISAVGFDLYTVMLARAVEELRSQGFEGLTPIDGKAPVLRSLPSTSIDLPVPAYIPQEYVQELALRLSLYQQLASVSTEERVEEIAAEMRDRFGPPPPEVDNLLYLVHLKFMAFEAGISRISRDAAQVLITVHDGMVLDREALSRIGHGVAAGVKRVRLDLNQLGGRWQSVLETAIRAIGSGVEAKQSKEEAVR